MIGESFRRTLSIFLYSAWTMVMIWLSSEMLWPILVKANNDPNSWRIITIIILPIFVGFGWGLTIGSLKAISDRWYFMPMLFLAVNVLAKGHLSGFQAIGGLIIYFLAGFGTYAYVYYGKRIILYFSATNLFWLLPSIFDSIVRGGLASDNTEKSQLFLFAFFFSIIFSFFSYYGFSEIESGKSENGLIKFLKKICFLLEGGKELYYKNREDGVYNFSGVQSFDFSCFVGEVVITQDCDGENLKIILENSNGIREGFSVRQKNGKIIFKAGVSADYCRALISLPASMVEVGIKTFGRVIVDSDVYGIEKMSIGAESLEVKNFLSVEDLFVSLFAGDKEVISQVKSIKAVNAYFKINGNKHCFEAESILVQRENSLTTGAGVKVSIERFGGNGKVRSEGGISFIENGLFIA